MFSAYDTKIYATAKMMTPSDGTVFLMIVGFIVLFGSLVALKAWYKDVVTKYWSLRIRIERFEAQKAMRPIGWRHRTTTKIINKTGIALSSVLDFAPGVGELAEDWVDLYTLSQDLRKYGHWATMDDERLWASVLRHADEHNAWVESLFVGPAWQPLPQEIHEW